MQRPFREYVRRFHYDTLTFWPESLKYLIDVVGSDRVVIGTDIYYGMDEEHPIEFVDQVKLAAADRDRPRRHRGPAAAALKSCSCVVRRDRRRRFHSVVLEGYRWRERHSVA